jgi:cob(I)alamin adenosyltransferase
VANTSRIFLTEMIRLNKEKIEFLEGQIKSMNAGLEYIKKSLAENESKLAALPVEA